MTVSVDIQGKVAIVTGAASGMGRAAALHFAASGASVVIADINDSGGAETERLIREAHPGAAVVYVHADVSVAVDVETMVDTAVQTYGRLDYAFNNAGVSTRAPLHELSEEAWDRVMDVDLKGVWLCMKYEIAHMLAQDCGLSAPQFAIVNTSSVLGQVGGDWGNSPYIAAKHGVIGLTQAAALEYGKRGIRVNAVCPGTIDTPFLSMGSAQSYARFHPIGRVGQPDEVAQAVVWLCSDAAAFITGHALAIDGGWLAQ